MPSCILVTSVNVDMKFKSLSFVIDPDTLDSSNDIKIILLCFEDLLYSLMLEH